MGRCTPRRGARDVPGGWGDEDEDGQVQSGRRERAKDRGGCPGGRRLPAMAWEHPPRGRDAEEGRERDPELEAARGWGGHGKQQVPGAQVWGRGRLPGRSPVSSGRGRGAAARRGGRAGPGSGGGGAALRGRRRRDPVAAAPRPAGRAGGQSAIDPGSEGALARLWPARGDNAALSGRKQPPRAASADAAPACAYDYAAAAAGVRAGLASCAPIGLRAPRPLLCPAPPAEAPPLDRPRPWPHPASGLGVGAAVPTPPTPAPRSLSTRP